MTNPTNSPRADSLQANGPEANGPEANGPEANGPEANGLKADSPEAVLAVTKVTVRADRIEVLVRVRDEACRFTTPELVATCCERFPELPQHACKNAKGPTFGAVMDRTGVPHLLEHLVISLQVRAAAQADGADERFAFLGTTEWLPDDSLTAKVSLSFKDDLTALASLKEAARFLNDILAQRA